MKKQILLPLALVALANLAFAQVIDSIYLQEFIVLKDGTKTFVDVLGEDYDNVIIMRNGKEKKILKENLLEWNSGNIWQQPFKYNEEGEIEYQEVVPIDSLTKDEIYNRAKRMFSKMFKDSRDVLELDDKEAGTLIGNGNTEILWKTDGILGMVVSIRLWFTVTIDVKDGKYRVTLNNFENETDAFRSGSTYVKGTRYPIEQAFPISGEVQKIQRGMKEAELLEIDSLLKSIKKMMAEKPSKDW
jgi:hypothetical protein